MLTNRRPIICNTLTLRGHQPSQRTDSEEKTVLGLPFVIRRKQKDCSFDSGALYVWCVNDYVIEVAERISSIISRFPDLEIRCPTNPRILLSQSPKQLYDASQQQVFLEIEDSICSRVWQCSNEIMGGDKFKASPQLDDHQERIGRTEPC